MAKFSTSDSVVFVGGVNCIAVASLSISFPAFDRATLVLALAEQEDYVTYVSVCGSMRSEPIYRGRSLPLYSVLKMSEKIRAAFEHIEAIGCNVAWERLERSSLFNNDTTSQPETALQQGFPILGQVRMDRDALISLALAL